MSDDLKKQIEEAVKNATTGLAAKNKELLGKLKKANTFLDSFKDVDVEVLLKESKQLKSILKKKEESDGNYKKLYDTQREQHQKDLTEWKAKVDAANSTMSNTIKESALSKALSKSSVFPEMLEPAITLLTDKVAVNDESIPMIGDKTVLEGVTEWLKSDTGKFFVSDGNNGGGANGPGSEGDVTAKFFDKKSPSYNLTEQAKIANNNPELHAKLKKQFSS